MINAKRLILAIALLPISNFPALSMDKDEDNGRYNVRVAREDIHIEEREDVGEDNFNAFRERYTREEFEFARQYFSVFREEYTYEKFEFAEKCVKNKIQRTHLTQDLLENNPRKNFIGYLYNNDLQKYVQVDDDNKWIYANKAKNKARDFIVREFNNNGDVEVTTQIGQKAMFLSWRYWTGAVELYDSYAPMTFTNWNKNDFEIRHDKQFMGTKSQNDPYGENALYYGGGHNKKFQYHFIDKKTLNNIEKNIYKYYERHKYSLKVEHNNNNN